MKKILKLIPLLFPIFSFCIAYSQENYILRDAVKSYLGQSNEGFEYAHLAEIHDSETSIAIFWPCVLDNSVVDDKIIALEFGKENNEWTALELYQGASLIALLSKTEKTKIVKQSSKTQIDSIPVMLRNKAKSVQNLLTKEEGHTATVEIEQLASLMSLNVIIENKLLSNIILKGVKSSDLYEKQPVNEVSINAKLEIYYQTRAEILDVTLAKEPTGWIVNKINIK